MKDEAKSMLREKTGDAALGQRPEPQKALVWETVKSELASVLEAAAAGPECTVGDAELSQKSHAENAIAYFDEIDRATKIMAEELDCEDDKHWFRETVAEVVSCAFLAGRNTQLALGKKVEAVAIAKYTQDEGNRANAVLGGNRTAQKAVESRAMLRKLALAPEIFPIWRDKSDKAKIRVLRDLARKYDAHQEDGEKLFSQSDGRMRAEQWFRDWLSDWQCDPDNLKIKQIRSIP